MSDATNLALIYSRLADLESQRDSSSEILQTITQKHSLDNLSSVDATAIDEKFNSICSRVPLVDAIRASFEDEHRIKEEVLKSLTANAAKYHAQKLSRDQMVADSFRLSESLKTLRPQVQDMGELCRNLQALDKEKADHHAKMLVAEQQKTIQIESECGTSLSSVTTKIDAEEADINAKAKENEELKVKLEQFKGHLELRREKLKNEQRTKELTEKLEAAKLAQKTYLEEQEKLKRDACKSKIVHTRETVLQLEQQLQMYDRKFEEFESTLTRTNEIMTQLAERELSLLTMVGKLRQDHAEWRGRASQAEVNLATVMEQKKKSEEELTEIKASAVRTEKKVRKLQAKRKEVMVSSSTVPTSSVGSSTSTAVSTAGGAAKEVLSSSSSPLSSSSASPARKGQAGRPLVETQQGADPTQVSTSSLSANASSAVVGMGLSVPTAASESATAAAGAEGLVGEGSPVASPYAKKQM